MAQRLGENLPGSRSCRSAEKVIARRFQKQIFLSVDIPSGFLSLQQEAEKGIVASLKELE